MNLVRRVGLWVGTNMAVIALFGVVSQALGLQKYFESAGQYYGLLGMALFFGFAGSFFSLMISKSIAKRSYRVQTFTNPSNQNEKLLFDVVQQISIRENIKMPEVGVYPSREVNAFATGPGKNSALVAVSQGLFDQMTRDEVEGVIGHEMAHVLNGDMVTMTLLQGVLNTFVIFFSRIIAQILASRNDEGMSRGSYVGMTMVFELVLGLFASLIVYRFSRWREYRADAGSARYVGRNKMIAALQKLEMMKNKVNPATQGYATMRINGARSGFMNMFTTHPPIDKRIEALQMSTEV